MLKGNHVKRKVGISRWRMQGNQGFPTLPQANLEKWLLDSHVMLYLHPAFVPFTNKLQSSVRRREVVWVQKKLFFFYKNLILTFVFCTLTNSPSYKHIWKKSKSNFLITFIIPTNLTPINPIHFCRRASYTFLLWDLRLVLYAKVFILVQ